MTSPTSAVDRAKLRELAEASKAAHAALSPTTAFSSESEAALNRFRSSADEDVVLALLDELRETDDRYQTALIATQEATRKQREAEEACDQANDALADYLSGENSELEELKQRVADLHEALRTANKDRDRLGRLQSRKEKSRRDFESQASKAKQQLAEAKALLKAREWVPSEGPRHDEPDYCLECRAYAPHHKPDCPLAALLEGGDDAS